MLIRYSVARCCCPKPGEPPPGGDERNYTVSEYGFWYPAFANVFDAVVPFAGRAGLSPDHFAVNTYLIFGNVDIPQGTAIVSAQLYFGFVAPQNPVACTTPPSIAWSGRDDGFSCVYGTTCRLRTYGEDADDATKYVTVAGLNGAARTINADSTHAVAINNTAVGAFATEGEMIDLVDITAAVQQILDRPGWISGNAMQFFVEENGSDFDNDPDPSIGFATRLSLSDTFGGGVTLDLRITLP